jgi:hypothetical protein
VSRPALDDRSLVGQRVVAARALRSGLHTYLVIRSARRDRVWRVVTVAAASLLADIVADRLVACGDPPEAPSRLGLDVADAIAWSAVVPRHDVLAARAVQLADTTASGIEAGYRLAAGGDAVPVVEPARPFPPQRPLVAIARAVAPAAMPAVAAAVVYRRRRLPTELNQLGWGLFSVTMGAAIARQRDRYQRRARAQWADTTRMTLAIEEAVGRVRAATASSPGHDFKKVLAALGVFGSAPAEAASREQTQHPLETIQATPGGMTALDAADASGVAIEPETAWTTWLDGSQVTQLADFVRATDAANPSATIDVEPVVRVVATRRAGVLVRYRGVSSTLSRASTRPDVRIDPVAMSLLLGAILKAITPITAGMRRAPALGAAAIDLGTSLHYMRSAPSDRDRPTVLGAAFTSAAVFDAAAALGFSTNHGASGELAFPATNGSIGAALALARYAPDARRSRGAAAALLFAMWAMASRRPIRANPIAAVAELCFLAISATATAGVDARIDHERTELERALERQLHEQVEAARHRGVRFELDRYRSQLLLAHRELASLGDAVPSDVHDSIVTDCDALARWLDDPETEAWLAS